MSADISVTEWMKHGKSYVDAAEGEITVFKTVSTTDSNSGVPWLGLKI